MKRTSVFTSSVGLNGHFRKTARYGIGAAVFVLTLALAAAPANPERWREVEKALDLDRKELAEVKAAPEAQRPAALLKYFQSKYPLVRTNPAKLNPKWKKGADEALAHRVKIRETPPSYRGEFPNYDWDTNGAANGDSGWMWILHRMGWWRYLEAAYLATGDERYVREWMNELSSWVDHMCRPGMEKHLGWRPLEIGLRLLSWPRRFRGLVSAPAMDEKTLVDFLYALNRQANHLAFVYTGQRDERVGNHDVTQQDGVLMAALAFPEFRASDRWGEVAAKRLGHYRTLVMLPDGVINEFIPGYHYINLDTFLRIRAEAEAAGREFGFDSAYDEGCRKGIDAILFWCHPDGTPMMAGDTMIPPGTNWRGMMTKYLKYYPERQDWKFFATAGKSGRPRSETMTSLPFGGYYSMRSDWTAKGTCVIAKNSCDTKGQFHNHYDNMSFEYSFGGKKLMVDSGSYSYHGSPSWRKRFKSSVFHQTVTLDGADNAARGRLLFQAASPGVQATALVNAAAPGLEHTRIIALIDGGTVVVFDLLTGRAAGELRAHFQFLPGDSRLDVAKAQAANVDLLVQGDGGGRLLEEEGFISLEYGVKTPRPAFAFAKHKTAGEAQYFATVIVPGGAPDAGIELLEPAVGDGLVRNSIRVTVSGGVGFTLDFDLSKSSVTLRRSM